VQEPQPTLLPQHALFYGEHELTLDDKNRLLVPAEIRKSLDPVADGEGLMVVYGPNGKPWFYTEKYWRGLVIKEDPANLNVKEAQIKYLQLNVGMARRVDGISRGA